MRNWKRRGWTQDHEGEQQRLNYEGGVGARLKEGVCETRGWGRQDWDD